jgi:predicted amidohydrolase YtcJ
MHRRPATILGLAAVALRLTALPALSADVVMQNGAIYTVNPQQPWAEALAYTDGVIVYVGDDAGAAAFIEDGTERIDLLGRMVLPGLHDVHTHPLEAGNPAAGTCILEPGTDPERQIRIIQACAPNQIGTDWVVGWGHFVDDLLNTQRPPAEILDEAVPDHPAIIMEFTSHSMWANSKALEAAGITRDTPDPVGGIIVRDPGTGEPNGLLIDNAGDIVYSLAFERTDELLDLAYDGLLYMMEEMPSQGITSIADARVYWKRGHHEVWQRAADNNALQVRTVLGLWGYPEHDDSQIEILKSLYSDDPESLLRISQIKIYADGIPTTTTAAMKEPYDYDYGWIPGNRGLNYFDEAKMTHYVTELEKAGFDFHIHAIGDRGIHEALNAIEAAAITNGDTVDRRHRLTHLELLDAEDIPRFAELNIIADFQLAGDWTEPHEYFEFSEYALGERARNPIPIASVWETGAIVTMSSDFDVSTMNPFVAMEHALTRNGEQLPDVGAAIAAYTINSAYTLRQEDLTGSLVVGKAADLIVIDQNLFEIDPRNIDRTRVLLTLLSGIQTWRSSDF